MTRLVCHCLRLICVLCRHPCRSVCSIISTGTIHLLTRSRATTLLPFVSALLVEVIAVSAPLGAGVTAVGGTGGATGPTPIGVSRHDGRHVSATGIALCAWHWWTDDRSLS